MRCCMASNLEHKKKNLLSEAELTAQSTRVSSMRIIPMLQADSFAKVLALKTDR